MSEPIKLTVNITQENAEILEKISENKHITRTAVLNQAIATESFIQDVKNRKAKFLIQEQDGTTKEVVFR